MARTETNFTAFGYAIEGATLSSWREVEANAEAITAGATLTTVARNPISADRQARKGVVTNLESSFSFTTDLTIDAVQNWVPAFLFVENSNEDLVWTELAANTTASYTVGQLSASTRAKLQYSSGGNKTLIFARGFSNDANNGLKTLGSVPAANATTLQVEGGNLVVETPPSNATVEVAGIRGGTGDLTLIIDAGGVTGTLDTTDSTADVDEWGLIPGQWIHIGGIQDTSRFQRPAGDDTTGAGFARVVSVSTSGGIILDKVDPALGGAGTYRGTGREVDILFGRFWRNVARDESGFSRPNIRFEIAHPDLGEDSIAGQSDGETLYSYSLGNVANQMTLNITPGELITASLAFIGSDTEPESPTRATGADVAIEPLANAGFNATSSVALIRIEERETGEGTTTDFTSLTFTINNNINTENVIGTLGARYVNTGNLAVTADATGVLNSSRLGSAIRDNTTMTMHFTLKNEEGGVVIDVPSMTISGGGKGFTENQSVSLTIQMTAFRDARFGSSISFSHFPILPN